jgi:GNAT superfamily N-acetyltransferase
MEHRVRLVEISKANLVEFPCCGIKNPAHEGLKTKLGWIEAYFKKGLRIKYLVDEDDVPFGYIEYLPGEYAWRGVEAPGTFFVHCLWTFVKKYQRQGFASRLLRACVDDARNAGLAGVAAMAREGPWLAGSGVYLKNGFAVVDTAPPDYLLMALKFKKTSPDPKFKGDWEAKQRGCGPGLTLIYSAQCPHIAKFAADIAEMAETAYRLKPRMIELKTHRDAQNAPTPYAVFAILYDGRLLADHQISQTRFRNIMEGVLGGPKAKEPVRRPV